MHTKHTQDISPELAVYGDDPSDGMLYVYSVYRIYKINPHSGTGTVMVGSVFQGQSDGARSAASFEHVTSMNYCGFKTLCVLDSGTLRVVSVETETVTRLSGVGYRAEMEGASGLLGGSLVMSLHDTGLDFIDFEQRYRRHMIAFDGQDGKALVRKLTENEKTTAISYDYEMAVLDGDRFIRLYGLRLCGFGQVWPSNPASTQCVSLPCIRKNACRENEVTSSSNVDACVCKSGYYLEAVSRLCVPCASGFWCGGESTGEQRVSCDTVLLNAVSAEGSYSAAMCTCPAGKTKMAVSGSTVPRCNTCQAGFWCPMMITSGRQGQATSFACDLGASSPANSQSYSDCVCALNW